jgi:hypothetical protein
MGTNWSYDKKQRMITTALAVFVALFAIALSFVIYIFG